MKKRAMTLIELLVVVIVVGILAAGTITFSGGIIKRANLGELQKMVEIIRLGAVYYDYKYDLSTFQPSDDASAWAALKIEKPPVGRALSYEIIDDAGDVVVQASYNGTPIYNYNIQTEVGAKLAHPDSGQLPSDDRLYIP
ncbi:prepilin-type N-terminal cleavage/methylation domain-containing protein [Candidatus Omnitrophota bacterium]